MEISNSLRNEIDEICKKLVFKKQSLPFEERSNDKFNSAIKAKDRSHNGFNVTESICGFVPELLLNNLLPQPNLIIPNYQTEPLDLSQKSNQSVDRHRSEPLLPKRMWKPKNFDFDKFFSTFIKRYTANDVCNARCSMLYKDHYHCFAENGHCNEVMKGKDKLRQHGKRHNIADELTKLEFITCVGCNLININRHYHCAHKNCGFISTEESNMDRLLHVEESHCVIISKRTNNHENPTRHFCANKKLRRNRTNEHRENDSESCQLSNVSSDNQFIEFDPDSIVNTINKNCINIIDSLSPDKAKVIANVERKETDTNTLLKIHEPEKNFFQNGCCSRLFCNLKKGDHYHCPICDRGSGKRDLYIRHLRQRHK